MSSFFMFSVFFEIVGSVMIAKPRNTAVVVGTSMALECRVANNSQVREWSVMRFSDRQTKSGSLDVEEKASIFENWGNNGVLVNVQNFQEFGVIVDAHGSGILYSNRSRLSDSGIYTCSAEVGLKVFQYRAEVTMLHEILQCEASFKEKEDLAENQHIRLRCSVTFKGNWVPVILWKHERPEGKLDSDEVMLDGSAESVIAGSNITSTLSVIATIAKNLSRYSGMVYFPPRNHSILPGADMNPPSYNYSWTSPVIKVIPRDTTKEDFRPDKDANVSGAASTEESNMTMGNLYTLVVIGVALLVVVITVIVTATLCIRTKRRVSESQYERNVEKSKSSYSTLTPTPKDNNDRFDGIYDAINDPYAPGNAYDKIDESCVDNPPVLPPIRPIIEPPSPGYLQARPKFLMESPYLESNDMIDKDYAHVQDQTDDLKCIDVNSRGVQFDKGPQTGQYLALMPDENSKDHRTVGYATSIECT